MSRSNEPLCAVCEEEEEEEVRQREEAIKLLLVREEYKLVSRELASLTPQDLAGG